MSSIDFDEEGFGDRVLQIPYSFVSSRSAGWRGESFVKFIQSKM
jgi:hypothetical protein